MHPIKNALLIYVCSIFLLTNASLKNMAKSMYPSFVTSATAGTVVGLIAPTAGGSLFILTVLTSPLFNTIPLAIGLFNSIKTIKTECHTLSLQNYHTAMQSMNINNLIDILGIAGACFIISMFTYYTCFDIANALKKSCINLFKKFI